jgi:hypothetical protein
MSALPEKRSEEASNASALDSRRQSLAGPDKPALRPTQLCPVQNVQNVQNPVNLSFAKALGLDQADIGAAEPAAAPGDVLDDAPVRQGAPKVLLLALVSRAGRLLDAVDREVLARGTCRSSA